MTGLVLPMAASCATQGFYRSCLIFESKRRPRDRCTVVELLRVDYVPRRTATMHMYNRMPRPPSPASPSDGRALLTTDSRLLTVSPGFFRVRITAERRHFSTRLRQGVLDVLRPMEGPGADGAHRPTPIETKAGRPRVAWSIHSCLLTARAETAEAFDGPAAFEDASTRIHGIDHQMVMQGDCCE